MTKFVIGIFVLTLFLAFIFFASFFNVFYEFELITESSLLWASLVASLVFAIVCTIVAVIITKKEKETKFGNWLSNNIAKITLAYTLLTVFFISIRAEVTLTIEDIRETISLIWTIFGITIALFLIWSVVVMEYLEKRKPNMPTSKFPTKIVLYISKKRSFYNDASFILSNITLLTVNLFELVVATIFTYISYSEVTVFLQSITTLTLLLSTNSIGGLFLDMLKPLNEKKKAMLQEAKVTSEDVDLQNEINEKTKIVIALIETIENIEKLSEEEKKQFIGWLLENYFSEFKEQMDKYSNPTNEVTP